MNYLTQITMCNKSLNKLIGLSNKGGILLEIAEEIEKNKKIIMSQNLIDVKRCKKDEAFVDRLRMTDERFDDMIAGVKDIAAMEDVIGKILEQRYVSGIDLQKVSVPLGVVLVIYEARPNVTVEAFCLAFKSGNAVVLKGGSEALATNRAIIQLIKSVLAKYNLVDILVFIENRKTITELLKLNKLISVVIPRGGKELVEMVQKKSTVPVLSHADGIDHIYVDQSADLGMAVRVIVDAKTNRPATCNTVDTVLIHETIAEKLLSILREEMTKRGVTFNKIYGREFLSLQLAIKIVDSIDEAIVHVQKYGSKHTEGIIAEDSRVIDEYVRRVDAAAVMVNCSTRLHDGGVFGMGAEMGIATGKLHARGPVGLKELTTYKWVAYGNGQTRGEL